MGPRPARHAKSVHAVDIFLSLFAQGLLFEMDHTCDDWHAPLNSDMESEDDENIFTKFGPYFGIWKHELNLLPQTTEAMLVSDVLLCMCSVLCLHELLCKDRAQVCLAGRTRGSRAIGNGRNSFDKIPLVQED